MQSVVVTFEAIYGTRSQAVRLFGNGKSIAKTADNLRHVIADTWGCSPLAVAVCVA